MRTVRFRFRTIALGAVTFGTVALGACASRSGAPEGTGPLPLPAPAPGTPAASAATVPVWPVQSRDHVDLWLHGLALLIDDTAQVPLFRRGYAEQVRAARLRGNVTTRLDAERDRLRARFGANPRLALNAQFAPFAFDSWEQLRRAAQLLVQTNGDPQRAGDQASALAVASLAGTFATAADREWLRVFVGALDDEQTRFYASYWSAQQRERSGVRAAVTDAWTTTQRKLARFLANTQQRTGELVLSLPLGGEGRTASGGPNGTTVTVTFPATEAAAIEAVYVAVHEVVGSTAGAVVSDNVSPADQRMGLADRYVSAAQVRGGYLLLQKTAPELAAGYARYYVAVAGGRATTDAAAALATTFPLPATLADALARQIDIVLGGI